MAIPLTFSPTERPPSAMTKRLSCTSIKASGTLASCPPGKELITGFLSKKPCAPRCPLIPASSNTSDFYCHEAEPQSQLPRHPLLIFSSLKGAIDGPCVCFSSHFFLHMTVYLDFNCAVMDMVFFSFPFYSLVVVEQEPVQRWICHQLEDSETPTLLSDFFLDDNTRN